MELWSLLALNCLSLSSEVAEKIASSHKQASVSLTPKLVWVLQWKRDINGLNKIWTRNHAVVASKYEDQSQKNDARLCLWLSTSTKTNILLVLVKK